MTEKEFTARIWTFFAGMVTIIVLEAAAAWAATYFWPIPR